MPFLSLGLQNEEQQKDERDRSALSDNTFPEARSKDVAATNSPLHQAEYNSSPVAPDTAASAEPESKLPPAIDELRRKIADNESDNNFAPLPPAVPDGIPTFTTFKFGYPGRGLLYSAIGHELALFGLFLLFTYGLPTLRPAKLVASHTQDHLIYMPELGGGNEGEKSPG